MRRSVQRLYSGEDRAAVAATMEGCCGVASPSSQSLPSQGIQAIPKLGVGAPMALLAPKAGETVLDLGSGLGHDVLSAARQVGPRGRAIGVDATPEMVFRAREAADSLHVGNAEFRLGEIEHLPIDSESVDGIASDCVINLSPAKPQVFLEAFRVLRPGGRLVVSDVVADKALPEKVRQDARRWAACEAGAVTQQTYVSLLRKAGFENVRAERKGAYKPGLSKAVVFAEKPRTSV